MSTAVSSPFNGETRIDVAKLFPGGSLPADGTVMNLDCLFPLVAMDPEGNVFEYFLTPILYVRPEIPLLMEELTTLNYKPKIVSGSPGIGKSMALFLAALWRAWKGDKDILYFRCTRQNEENASLFQLRKMDASAGKLSTLVHVKFNRSIVKAGFSSPQLFRNLIDQIHGWQNMIVMVDGPKPTELHLFSGIDSLCTSGGGVKITSEMRATTIDGWRNPAKAASEPASKQPKLLGTKNVVMSAWTKDRLKAAIMACEGETEETFNEELFDEIYFVTGGRIREALRSYKAKAAPTEFASEAVSKASKSAATLALARDDERSTSDLVDALRSIFRRERATSCDEVDILVDSQFIMRKLNDKIDGQELLRSYKTAKERGYSIAAAEYFEELVHWCYCQPDLCPDVVRGSVRSQGKGAEGVRELKSYEYYWVPSVPNFVNIDAALVRSDGHVYCFQYTTHPTHSYKKRKLRTQFINIVNETIAVNDTTIIFVTPDDITFTAPDTADECNTAVRSVDCSTLDSVKVSLNGILSLLQS